MSLRAILQIVAGCFLGVAIAAAFLYGMIELVDLMVGWTDALH